MYRVEQGNLMGVGSVYVSFDGDDVGRKVGLARLADDVEEVRRVAQSIDRGNEVWKSFALGCGGSVVQAGGDEGAIEIPIDKLEELPNIKNQYETAVGCTVTIGVGMRLSESAKALLSGKLTGKDKITFFGPAVDRIIQEAQKQHHNAADKELDEYMDKAEQDPMAQQDLMSPMVATQHRLQKAQEGSGGSATAHPGMMLPGHQHAEEESLPPAPEGTHAAQDFEDHFHSLADQQEQKDQQVQQSQQTDVQDVKAKVAKILQVVKQQAPQLAQLAQQAPDTYGAIMAMTQAVMEMARRLPTAQAAEPVQKSETQYCKACKDPLDANGHCKVKSHWAQLDAQKREREPNEPPLRAGVLDKEQVEKAALPMPRSTPKRHPPLPVGSEVDQKEKVIHASGGTGWVSLKAGQIRSQDPSGHPISVRNPGGR